MKMHLPLASMMLLLALCSGIPTEDQQEGVISEEDLSMIKSLTNDQYRDNEIKMDITDNGLQEEYQAAAGNEGNAEFNDYKDNTHLDELDGEVDYFATEALPDHESLVGLVKTLQHKVKELEYLSYRQRSIVSANSDLNTTDQNYTDTAEMEAGWFKNNQASGGGLYIRWGRDNCPSTANKVYAGFVAATRSDHTGGGSNYLCLPNQPIYDEVVTSGQTYRARLLGMDYEMYEFPLLAYAHEQDPPCAICETMERSKVLMVPARNDCPTGWTTEYSGYLTANREDHYRTEFVCLDHNPEIRPGTSGENEGGNFFLVEGHCTVGGGIPCGPYVAGYELTCAVCTK